MNQAREYFFSGVRNPANISEVVTSLAAGNPFEVERLPDELLPVVTLLATAAIGVYNQKIVDDYYALLRRVEEKFGAKDMYGNSAFSAQIFWHPQLMYVSRTSAGRGAFMHAMSSVPECAYIIRLYEELVNTDLEELFPWRS